MSRKNLFVGTLALAALLFSACSLVPPPHPGTVPTRILFIGTSDTFFNAGLDFHLRHMAVSGVPPIYIETAAETRGGAPLAQLWQIQQVQERIAEGDWDVVVVEGEYAMGADVEDAQSYTEHLRMFDELIRNHGGRTVAFMDWQLSALGNQAWRYPQIEEIAAVVSDAATQIDVDVAPVGLAWAKALAEQPELQLYDSDGGHPNIAGTYLTTAVFYATLFGRSPEGLTYLPAELLPDTPANRYQRSEWRLTPPEREFLQRIAWETVQEYQAQ